MFPTWLEARKFMRRYGETYEAAKAGVGLAECAARTAKIITERKPGTLILAGLAGAYEGRGIKKGETVLVERENSSELGSLQGDFFRPISKSSDDPSENYYICNTAVPPVFRKVTSNSVNICAVGHHNDLLMEGAIENMEGASFFAVCNALGIKGIEIRTICNFVGEAPTQWIIEEATENLAVNLKKLLDALTISRDKDTARNRQQLEIVF